jgi:NAD(P)-dependent dehydrogenase (short-subunit alcohol dehydrogenase family)
MDIRLDGRAAVISGASRGLGLAMARQFAASGADVAMLARRPDVLEEARASVAATATGRVAAVPCDVARADEVERAFAAVTAALGRVDIVVNNAGAQAIGPFEAMTDAVLQADLELKLFGAVRLTRLAWPQMKERRWGRVINVLNLPAKAARPGTAPTAISRAAGLALTKVLAGEGAPHGILVNALLVGSIVTDQVRKWHAQRGAGRTLEQFIADLGKPIPLGRMGTAEEFAALACFLASDAAGYVTGTAINVDGGLCPVV